MAIVTRKLGTCPICEGRFKLHPGKGGPGHETLVHHGYKRPGWGYIVGDCFAVGWRPYELSSEVCIAYLKKLAVYREAHMKALQELESRPLTLGEVIGRGRDAVTYTYRRDSNERIEVRYHGAPLEKDAYERVRKSRIAHEKSQIKMIDLDSERMRRLVAAWTPKPLIEVDEEGRTRESRDAAEARKTERAVLRAAKEAKRAELDRKRGEREIAQEATLNSFIRKFHALAQMPKSAERDLQARRLNAEMQKKKYKLPGGIAWEMDWADPRRRGVENDLVELGLGAVSHTGELRHFSWHRHLVAAGAPVVPENGNGGSSASAEKHERGENPRTLRNVKDVKLKDRMMALVGRGKRRF
jgi:hypothetical protein